MIDRLNSERLKRIWTDTPHGRMHAYTNRAKAPPGPVVVLTYGFVISSLYMIPTAHLLAERCRIFAVDLPGYGETPFLNLNPTGRIAAA